MSASKGKISSFFKRNKKQIEDLANDEGVKELISEVKGVKPEDVAKTLGDTAAKLDELAKKEEADGSVSTAVVGFLSKGDKKESKSAKIKSQIVSLAIKNWRYSIPLLSKCDALNSARQKSAHSLPVY